MSFEKKIRTTGKSAGQTMKAKYLSISTLKALIAERVPRTGRYRAAGADFRAIDNRRYDGF